MRTSTAKAVQLVLLILLALLVLTPLLWLAVSYTHLTLPTNREV